MADRHQPAKSLLFAEFCKKFPVLRRMSRGDRFVSDCAHHHPVFPNRGNRRRSEMGSVWGDVAAYFQRCRSLVALTVSRADFWSPVSASKNSVPGDWISAPNQPGPRELGLLRSELRAAFGPIADSIRGFRTVGSIPRERRGSARVRAGLAGLMNCLVGGQELALSEQIDSSGSNPMTQKNRTPRRSSVIDAE